MTLINELLDLYNQDKDVALVFDGFVAIDRIYQDSLRAMGYIGEAKPVSKSSANITISTGPGASTTGQLTHVNSL